MKWAAYDIATGWAEVFDSQPDAEKGADRHNEGCCEQGGYGSAAVYRVDEDGYLIDEHGDPVWPPHGRSTGAVRV